MFPLFKKVIWLSLRLLLYLNCPSQLTRHSDSLVSKMTILSDFKFRRFSWHILLLLFFQACSPQLTKGPIGLPNCSEERFLSYPNPGVAGAKKSLSNIPEQELQSRLQNALRELQYGFVDTKSFDQGFEIKTGFHSQGDRRLTKNMFVQIALILKVEQQAVAEMDIRYCVAWARRKEPKWRYDQFPKKLQCYIEKFFDRLYEEIDKP